MYIQNWGMPDWEKNYFLERIKDENEKTILFKMLDENTNVCQLSSIEIETINRCNNDCSFCPVNRNDDIRTPKIMKEELFYKIIDDLCNIKYTGVISLFSNNEPLLDTRLLKFLKYAKNKLPNATHALYTNGILLNNQKYEELTDLLDLLVIDNYNDDLIIRDEIEEIIENKKERYKGCKVLLQNRKKNQVLLNRGGLAPNQKAEMKYTSPCMLPYMQMVVRPDGKVSRCCQDAYGNETLGDLSEESVMEIWQGEKYNVFRKRLHKNRAEVPYCCNCDVVGFTNYYPQIWNSIYNDTVLRLLYEISTVEKKKIVLFNCRKDYVIKDILHNYNILVDSIAINENIECYLNRDLFIVMDQYDEKVIKILEEKGKKVGQDFIVWSWAPVNQWYSRKKEKDLIVKKLLEDDKEGKIVLYGAGETAKALIGYYHFHPKLIIDTYKAGELFMDDYHICALEDIYQIQNYTIIIAAADYYPIVKKLRKYRVPGYNIVFGINLL